MMQFCSPPIGTYKSLLLRAADEASFGRTLSATVTLGRAFSAHIIGLSVLPQTIPVPSGTPDAPDAAHLNEARRAARAEHARLAPIFHRRCDDEALTANWVVADPDNRFNWTAASRVVRAVDLIVAPTPTTTRALSAQQYDTEDLLLSAGRPLLLLPRGAELYGRPERILVAWNASREATRAVFDALPLLQSARVVTLTSVGKRHMEPGKHTSSSIALARALERLGVHVQINDLDVAVPEVGTALLAAAKAEGSELLVIGGCGRSRCSELILGGTTRHVLRYTHVPVLISH